ncbi:NAD(P)-binding domain-containing protein [Waterburya agarophytonicola K14]|uniref:NAD(P)-binding domain-containing protein n=1 Tax=Waterburya agarophytonicola KI4 TaxID=2874699 RepID=A0A964BM03_9CYAN|nr:NAD(P)-binding domain-containing protein [Waterburya agarophytonicola]MCC0175863.1 NAD(P)-binding domain-containing protein [Waterburya agarophytonicola KI4]
MNATQIGFFSIVATIVIQRILAMCLGKKNAKYLYSVGGIKKSDNLVKYVRVTQISWLLAATIEVYLTDRRVIYPLAITAIGVTIASQIIRMLSAKELGYFWTHPIIIKSDRSIVNTGIYSYIRHPAWLAMGLEITFVPLIHNAYLTAFVFTAINFFLSSKRIATEEKILSETTNYSILLGNTPRFIPRFSQSKTKNINCCDKPNGMASRPIGNPLGQRALVIGAGAAGLAAMDSLQKAGILFDAVEKYSEIGGLWNYNKSDSPVSQNTHAIGHKSMQMYSGLSMPEDYPAYPSNQQILDYLIDYAKNRKLYEHIQFGISVDNLERLEQAWRVTLSNQEVRTYRWVLIASGQHNDPHIPQFEGEFTGEIIHSSKYKQPEQLLGKKVLVVGAGQSAMDILEDSATTAQKTIHSSRSSFYIGNKFIFGFPAEKIANFPIIKSIPTQLIFKTLAYVSPILLLLQGINLSKLNIPQNDFKNRAIKPVFNQTIYQYYLQGDLIHKPKIQTLKDNWVIFEDGSAEEIDFIVCATGFNVSFPFIEKKFLNWRSGKKFPSLYLHCFHPNYDNLFVIGMIQPIGTHWQVFEAQSRLVASYIQSKIQNVPFCKIDRLKQNFDSNIKGKKLSNESLLVDKRLYIKQIQKLIA